MSGSPPGSDPVALDRVGDPVAALFAAARTGTPVCLPTSGTTGPARRVVRTAGSWVDSFPLVAELIGLSADSRGWVPGPVSASMNLYARALLAWSGARLSPGPDRASHAFLTPYDLERCLDEELAGCPDRAGSSERPERPGRPERPERCAVVAGDRLPPSLAARATVAGWRIHHYYGAAQLSFVAWGTHADDLRAFPGIAVEDRDGVLWVRSPWVCVREEGPAPALTRAGDWASVGDRGVVLPDGRVRIDGRPEVIVTGGATVYVADVESVLQSAALGTVRLVGLPHPRLGAVVAAACTQAADVAVLPGVARARLAPAARPRRWRHIAELPLTAAGKLDRRALAQLVEGA